MTRDSVWLRSRRTPGRLGVVGVSQLLVFQMVQVGLLVVLVQGTWAAALGGVVGTLAIVGTFGRWRGRWASELVLLWLRHRRRRGVLDNRATDPRLAVLGELVGDLAVEEVPGPDEAPMGMGSDGAGWFAVLEVEPSEGGVDPPVPLAALSRIGAEAGVAGVVMQVVSHAVPVSADPTDRQRHLWVAVRLDSELVAAAMVDDPEPTLAVPAVLAELTRRVHRALRRRGLRARVLDADGVIEALLGACDLTAHDSAGPQPGQIHEDWDAWHSARLAHRCFWLSTWPDADRGTGLLGTLAELPGIRVSVALMLEPRPDASEADLLCLVRLATPREHSRQIGELVTGLAAGQGAKLFPLDGEHALAVYASAPSGGGAR